MLNEAECGYCTEMDLGGELHLMMLVPCCQV